MCKCISMVLTVQMYLQTRKVIFLIFFDTSRYFSYILIETLLVDDKTLHGLKIKLKKTLIKKDLILKKFKSILLLFKRLSEQKNFSFHHFSTIMSLSLTSKKTKLPHSLCGNSVL